MYKASETCVYTVTQANLLVDWEVCIQVNLLIRCGTSLLVDWEVYNDYV